MRNRITLILVLLLAVGPRIYSQADDQVTATVSVLEKFGGVVKDLKKSDFRVFDKGSDRAITSFAFSDAPASIVILLDASESTTSDGLRSYIRSALNFIDSANDFNEYRLALFRNDFSVGEWVNGETMRLTLNALGKEKNVVGKNTKFFDAFILGIDELEDAKFPVRALLVLSDGKDTNSKATIRQAISAVKESVALVFSISLSNERLDYLSSMELLHASNDLRELSKVGGGRHYLVETESKAIESAKLIANMLRSRYTLAWKRPTGEKSGEWRKVAIVLTDSAKGKEARSLVVFARAGYYY